MSEPAAQGASSPTGEPASVGDGDRDEQHPRKRQRVRLSCLECRRRKLSCDRGFPCERCIKSGTPERCSYETRPGLAPPAKNGLSQTALSTFEARLPLPNGAAQDLSAYRRDASRDADRIRRLEQEVSQLKSILTRVPHSDESVTLNEDSPRKTDLEDVDVQDHIPTPSACGNSYHGYTPEADELRFFRGKEFRTRYFGPHNALMAFSEVRPPTHFTHWLKSRLLTPPRASSRVSAPS